MRFSSYFYDTQYNSAVAKLKHIRSRGFFDSQHLKCGEGMYVFAFISCASVAVYFFLVDGQHSKVRLMVMVKKGIKRKENSRI